MSVSPNLVDWLSVALLSAGGLLSGLLELMFLAQFYAGSTIVPVAVVAAVVLNVVLPICGFRAIGRMTGAVLPVVAWLVAVLALTLYNRPEGDVFVINGYEQQDAFYGLLLAGTIAGFITIVVVLGRPGNRQ